MTVKVTGQRELKASFGRFRASVKAELSDELVKGVETIRSNVVMDINEQGSSALAGSEDASKARSEAMRAKYAAEEASTRPAEGATDPGPKTSKRKKQKKKTGREAHVPSQPGQPPNADTGNLSARYTTEFKGGRTKLIANVVAGVIYAFWLEYGTRKMAARPHLHPRFDEEAPKLTQRLREALARAAKSNGRRA